MCYVSSSTQMYESTQIWAVDRTVCVQSKLMVWKGLTGREGFQSVPGQGGVKTCMGSHGRCCKDLV